MISILLLLPLLAGTLGISAREHRCASSNKASIKLFPELTGQVASCCCSSESPSSASSGGTGSETFDAPDCCKTIQLYFKASFQTTQAQAETSLAPIHLLSGLILPPDLKFQKAFVYNAFSFYVDTGPPLTGRQRIISFHQSKIPCHSFLLS
ncbi:MAG: hypothetical protein NTY96_02345 [Bacteroidetes bacterium]|nr:hypothetical protein [Bacteroidota bacterium]